MKKRKRRAVKPVKPLKRPSKNLTRVLFAVYLIVLTWIIVFKMETDLKLLGAMNFRSINLIPFGGSLVTNGQIDVSEIVLNVAAFVPFGVYITMLHKSWNFLQRLLPIFGVSLLYETVQYIFAIGGSDITDLLGNTLGGILGMVLFLILWAILGRRSLHIINVAATVGTVAVVLLLGVLTVLNL